ncbi:MAG: alpha/beta fold hydrolase [Promicromonosporaceae bacterium]|nr:alpha/beta fold hydrolase [Promicromonosporaceae bacterium]
MKTAQRQATAAGLAGMGAGAALAALFTRRAERRRREAEDARWARDLARVDQRVCATRYPLLLVHGVGGLRWTIQHYWGRIPDALARNGARVYQADHQSTQSIAAAGREVADQLDAALAASGAERFNLIAHSKGGLDARWAIARLGCAPRVASLTTIGTPHYGCGYVPRLTRVTTDAAWRGLNWGYNQLTKWQGVSRADLQALARDLTPETCARLNALMPDDPGVLYRSTGTAIRGSQTDGLVPTSSMVWGQWLGLIPSPTPRGIDHASQADLLARDVRGFDVTEAWVQLVAALKDAGL